MESALAPTMLEYAEENGLYIRTPPAHCDEDAPPRPRPSRMRYLRGLFALIFCIFAISGGWLAMSDIRPIAPPAFVVYVACVMTMVYISQYISFIKKRRNASSTSPSIPMSEIRD